MAPEEGLQAARSNSRGLHPLKITAYLTNVQKRDIPLKALAQGFNAQLLDCTRTHVGGLSLLWGFDEDPLTKYRECVEKNLPFFHMDHAYFKRGYEHGNCRVNFCHFHQTKILDVPADRSAIGRKRLREWKRDGSSIVVVVPSERICLLLGTSPKNWVRQVTAEIKQHTDRPIFIKEKGGSILDAIKNAWATVSLSSVAEVESVMFGVPVFVSRDSPALPMGLCDLSKIETPVYPERDPWINSLSYSQFHTSEMASGKAADILRNLYVF